MSSSDGSEGRPTVFVVLPHDTERAPHTLSQAIEAHAHVIAGHSPEDLLQVADQIDVVLTWGGGQPRSVLERSWPALKRLRWIHQTGVGLDALLFPELATSDVVVTNNRGLADYPVAMAEFALSLITVFSKRVLEIHANQRRHLWERLPMAALSGQTLVIVGLGSIGAALATRALALGMGVHATKRHPERGGVAGVNAHPSSALDTLLPIADYVVLAVPLTLETHHLIGAAELARMKPGAVLINMSRGRVLHEAELVRALTDGRLGGAALDAFEHEPVPADSALWDVPNLFMSPHMSAFVSDPTDVLVDAFIANLARYLRGKPLERVVDKRAGY